MILLHGRVGTVPEFGGIISIDVSTVFVLKLGEEEVPSKLLGLVYF
jgi:hypothetical protein